MEPGDLIDFETILETPKPDTFPFGGIRVIQPPQDRDEKNVFEKYVQGPIAFPPLFPGEEKFYFYCHWLKIGKKERCGKLCDQPYCKTHSEYINKGGKIPLPCLCCGDGVRRHNQLCTRCEKKYEVEYK